MPHLDPEIPPIAKPGEVQPILRWGLDLCQNTLFGPVIRPIEHEPGGFGSEGNEGVDGFQAGFFEVRSMHPIRAMEMPDARPNEQVCTYHYGKMTLSAVGNARPVFCGQPVKGRQITRRGTALLPYIQSTPDPNGLVETGFFALLGSYHTPNWTEAHFNSHAIECVGGEG